MELRGFVIDYLSSVILVSHIKGTRYVEGGRGSRGLEELAPREFCDVYSSPDIIWVSK